MVRQKTMRALIEFIGECRKEMPGVTDDILCENGAIYYMNGNDSTPFDWNVNGHTCDFFLFYKSTEMGFIKTWICDDGTAIGMIFKEEYKPGDEPIIKEVKNFVTKKEARAFYKWLCRSRDNRSKYDEKIY